MLINQVSERYAKSLLELATEKKVVAQVAQDMYTLKEMLEHNNDFRSLMRSPVISFYKKDM
ncbi:MAG: F0F1 ATP synthase subunit delta, partial [Chitinophagaceae bacterium]